MMAQMYISHKKAKYALNSNLTRPGPTLRFLNAYISETIRARKQKFGTHVNLTDEYMLLD